MNTTPQPRKPILRIDRAKIRPAFWTVASTVSLAINLVLIVIVLLLIGQIFTIKRYLSDQLVGGLYQNFVLMDQAKIQANVQVDSTIPVQFELPVQTETTVILTEDTTINGARVDLTTGGLYIQNAPADIVLPAGTRLPIALDIRVPVDTRVPVQLDVPVDIPLAQTELHQPFTGLQGVVAPYYQWLQAPPNSWGDLLCGAPGSGWCHKLFD